MYTGEYREVLRIFFRCRRVFKTLKIFEFKYLKFFFFLDHYFGRRNSFSPTLEHVFYGFQEIYIKLIN